MKKTAVSIVVVAALPSIIFLWSVAVWGSDYELGKKIYEEKCLFCHGSNGNGNGPAAPSLSTKPADFNHPTFWQQYDEKKMTDVIRNGRNMMPAFDLKPDQVKAVIDYITRTYKKSK